MIVGGTRRRLLLAAAALLANAHPGRAQPGLTLRRIGVLMPSTPEATANLVAAFEQGLREQGYTQGKNIVIDYRYTGGQSERVAPMADELVRAGATLILTTTDAVVGEVARRAHRTAIVMVNASDPVRAGLVKTLAQPGGNVTGLTNLSPEIGGKRVELLNECTAALSRITYLWDSRIAGAADDLTHIQSAARRLKLELQLAEAHDAQDIERALARLAGRETGLLVQAPNPLLYTQRALIARLAAVKAAPSMFNRVEYVVAGGLMSYGPNVPHMYRRSAVYVDKILRGGSPAQLPVEQPSQFELALNLNTAQALGIELPPSLLGRAETIIR
jgi:putative tryptophan/tyrosine transport system substrate-binding protein